MSPLIVDWGAGRYERTADELRPAAETIIALARVQPGQRVLDVACGTGNAALLAARAGAAVEGIDLAARLIEVARGRAQSDGLRVEFEVGDAQALPFGDGTFDLVVSVFGVIFAPDPGRALSEVVRVLRPDGRALITAWTPDGAISAVTGLFAKAVAQATNSAPAKRFAWHDADAIAGLAADNSVAGRFLDDRELTFTAASAEDLLGAYEQDHPVNQAIRPILDQAGTYDATRAQALAVLAARNESSDRFAVTSRYRIIEIAR